jgi:hypothetical protein
VINRRQAFVGYLTFRAVRALAQRRLRRTAGGLRPGYADGGSEMRQTKNARAAADRAAALVDQVRPIVTRAMNDPELHDALRQAFSTGREVKDEISGQKPSKAARRIAQDRKLQKRVESSAQDLQKAVSNLVEEPKKKGRVKRLIGRVAVIGAVAGGVVVVLKKLRRGGDEPPY